MYTDHRPAIAGAILLTAIGLVPLLNGCTRIQRTVPNETEYNTIFSMSGLEYETFISKEIGVVENLLVTRIIAARSIDNGTGATDNELANVKEDITKLDDIIEDVTYTKPALGYETDTENTLSLMKEARAAIESYQEALENKGDVKTPLQDMQNCYIALGGEANVYYE